MNKLDIYEIARIGLIFLDGDKLEHVLNDRYSIEPDDIDYNHAYFNELKATLLKIERMNPSFRICSVLWQPRPDNRDMVTPVIFGSEPLHQPREVVWPHIIGAYWAVRPVNDTMRKTLSTGETGSFFNGTCMTFYFAVKNSDDEIVGVLELQYQER